MREKLLLLCLAVYYCAGAVAIAEKSAVRATVSLNLIVGPIIRTMGGLCNNLLLHPQSKIFRFVLIFYFYCTIAAAQVGHQW
jgi:hypothetical protein